MVLYTPAGAEIQANQRLVRLINTVASFEAMHEAGLTAHVEVYHQLHENRECYVYSLHEATKHDVPPLVRTTNEDTFTAVLAMELAKARGKS